MPFSLLKKGMSFSLSLVFGDEFLAQGLHLKSHQKCSDEIRTWLSADQSSSSPLTESSFLFDPCLIHRCIIIHHYMIIICFNIKLCTHGND